MPEGGDIAEGGHDGLLGLGRLAGSLGGRDQVLDYHRRKGMDLGAVERWLRPSLGYDPAD